MALALNRINTNMQDEFVLLEHSAAEPIFYEEILVANIYVAGVDFIDCAFCSTLLVCEARLT